MEWIDLLFGHGKDLTILQMCCRAFVLFFITLILIRIAGMRAFGFKTAFDSIIVILLGAILSRAVTGASAFLPTIMAGLTMSLTHRICGFLSMKNPLISKLLKGNTLTLYKDGKLNEKNMQRCNISKGDLMESLRLNGHVDTFAGVKEVIMERNGQISIIR